MRGVKIMSNNQQNDAVGLPVKVRAEELTVVAVLQASSRYACANMVC